jgi:hypothetical protein
MNLLALATAVSVVIEPITTRDVIGHLTPAITCAGRCSMVSVALLHVTGEVAASATPGACGETVQLEHVPFGAHLVPHAVWHCDGVTLSATGPPVTIAPYLTNVEVDTTTVWIPALAEPRGPERLKVRLWGEEIDLTRTFPTRELVLRDIELQPGKYQVRAVFEPYGIASNARSVHIDPPSLRWTATEAGCTSTPLMLSLVFFRRRRFPSPGPIC